MPALSLFFASYDRQICRDHLLHHIIEAGPMPPAKPLTGL
jgi:hypothetical protein